MKNSEIDLYPEIEKWFNQYLKEKYSRYKIITTCKTSQQNLDDVLREYKIELKETIGLGIKIDIVGILMRKNVVKLAFIEVKNKNLTLRDLGQLWGYCQLIDPIESFLISSKGLGSLINIIKTLKREDLLTYGLHNEKMMKIAKWDEIRKCIDSLSILPKL